MLNNLLSYLLLIAIVQFGHLLTSVNGLLFNDLVIVICHEESTFDATRAQVSFLNLQNSINKLNHTFDQTRVHLRSVPEDYELTNWWIYVPLLIKIQEEFSAYSTESLWTVIIPDTTTVDLHNLVKLLESHSTNLEKPLFLGRGVRDEHATIIHHFAFFENPSIFVYPNTDIGFAVNWALLKRLPSWYAAKETEYDFSIDAKYEVAKFFLEIGEVTLTETNSFCDFSSTPKTAGCALTLGPLEEIYNCANRDADLPDVAYAVKTFSENHKTRVPVIQRTWGRVVKHLKFYSDTDDLSIPTVKVPVSNTARGHCAKTMHILKNFVEYDSFPPDVDWLILTDDDTLIGDLRLRRLLSCYDHQSALVIGERYGYGLSTGNGYSYITTGGGMALSRPAVSQLFAESCRCNNPDDPDDMILGMCLTRAGISIIHSPLFHQARPIDYSSDYLRNFKSISFHRFTDIDPHKVYLEYLGGSLSFDDKFSDKTVPLQHTEL